MRVEEWVYWDIDANAWSKRVSRAELDALYRAGTINGETLLTDVRAAKVRGPRAATIPYAQLTRVTFRFLPTVEQFLSERENAPTTILSGPNNSGKSLLLKQIFYWSDPGTYFVQCSRFSHVDIINTRQLGTDEFRGYHENFLHGFHTNRVNNEDNQLKLEQILTGLTESRLNTLFRVCGDLLNCKLQLKKVDDSRPFSPFYVDMDGQNLRYGSSGTRLLITLVGIALDENISALIIDEPELGLSPRIQGRLARMFYDDKTRKEHFPNLKQLYLATHSHLFLDRKVLSNNWLVTKAGDDIALKQVASVGELHELQFTMLGNDIEDMFLPSAIVLAEGESDVAFLRKVFVQRVPDKKITVAWSGGDGGMGDRVNFLNDVFGDFRASPFRDRFFALVDSKNSLRKSVLIKQGVKPEHIKEWKTNGIEYLYPADILTSIFKCSTDELAASNLESDPIEINGIRRTKKELSAAVAEALTPSHTLPTELTEFVQLVKTAT